MEQRPEWMKKHEESDQRNFDAINETLKRMEGKQDSLDKKLTPIANTYDTASLSWKWFMGLMAFVGGIVALAVGVMKLLGK